MNLEDTDITLWEDMRVLQTTKHFSHFCDRVNKAAMAHPDFRTISSRIAFYIQGLLTVKEAYAKLEYVRRRTGELLDAKKIGCFNRHELNPLGNKVDLPKPRIIFPKCDWKGHRSCGHPDLNGNLGLLTRATMFLPDLDSTEVIMPAINMIHRDVVAANLSRVERFNSLVGVDQFEEAERVVQLIHDEQLRNDQEMIRVLTMIQSVL